MAQSGTLDIDRMSEAEQQAVIDDLLREIDELDASIKRTHQEIDRIGERTQRKLDRLAAQS